MFLHPTTTLLPVLLLALSPAALSLQDQEILDELPMLREALFDVTSDDSSAAQAVPEGSIRIYDIGDLVDRTPTINPKELERRQTQQSDLAELLIDKLPPELRAKVGRIDATSNGVLVVHATLTVHDAIERFLTAQRTNEATVLQIGLTMFQVPHGLLADQGLMGSSMLFETGPEFAAMRERIDQMPGVTTISAPQLAVHPRSWASVELTKQVAYVSDFELLVVQPGDQEIVDPVIAVVEDGIKAELRAVPMPFGLFDLECKVSYAILERPMQSRKVRVGAGEGFEVEVTTPVVEELKISSLLSVASGAGALIATTSEDREFDFVTMVQLTRMELPLSEPSPAVRALFQAMRDGAYPYKWFPPLEWDDIPGLLMQAQDTEAVSSFPRSPLSDVRPPQVISGAVALWLIEGLREEGHIPSFAPLLAELGQPLDAAPAKQRELLERARGAYRAWWAGLEEGTREPNEPSPLGAAGLRWF